MVVGIGIDVVEVHRLRKALEGGTALIQRVFTEEEVAYCNQRKNRFQHFSGRFAAKEAALKALGTGWRQGIRWRDVEVTAGDLGKPALKLHGRAKELFDQLGVRRALVSISHAEEYAVALVLLES